MNIDAALLTEQMAPVSGARCRDCGARPWRKPGAWLLDRGCAYCPACAIPHEKALAKQTLNEEEFATEVRNARNAAPLRVIPLPEGLKTDAAFLQSEPHYTQEILPGLGSAYFMQPDRAKTTKKTKPDDASGIPLLFA